MRTALLKQSAAPGAVELIEHRLPQPGPADVLLDLVYAGICHTDINMLEGAYGPGSGYSPTYPVVLGHEFTARVRAVGSEVDDLEPGARVISGCHLTCGTCRWCSSGRSMLCERRQVIGLDTDGCWATSFVMPRRNLVEIPAAVSDKLAALAEPFAVGAHAVDLASVQTDERIAIVGPGTLGLLTLGALTGRDITVVGRRSDTHQLKLAQRLGASSIITGEEAESLVGSFDVVFETAGSGDAGTLGARLLASGGRLICVGLPKDNASIDTAQLAWHERTIIGSRAYDLSTWQTIPERLKAAPQLEEIATHTFPLADLDSALTVIRSGEAIKVLLHP